ncbi:dynein regulation protein LC7 [Streptomyces pluripotens]|uniref:Dynein regulation protein LC7 n=2 Tax=Streptomyces TaxID=1883 RepID=A0A221P8N6_9ACTN|nr:dynein regulation protein LC7 [Streptomyces pluripotens]ASN28456.1 dynein regulation protein LC7 [Streptomyces pluripotens]KIE26057.1 dynein regulation protein LC7 [Streptomyces sp. MUSC 125]MCH0557202.1 roadblock/LC7 domain-containing protein [Streptomyces sp. MUM 16J]
MVKDIVDNVPRALHAVVLSSDGISRGATDGMTEKGVRTVSAAMAGMQSLSRATARFAGPVKEWQWNQTIVEFSHGWVFLVGAGPGAYLAAAAEPDVDLQQISFRMHRLVARLGDNLTSAPRVNGADGARALDAQLVQDEARGGPGFVLPELDTVVAEVRGARHAVLLGADGLPRGTTSGMGKDLADTMSAAMTGLHAYSRATAQFADGRDDVEWLQTVIEFQHGWVFLIAAGDGAYLAASAEHDCDIEEYTTRLKDVVPALGTAAAPRGRTAGDA